MGNINLNNNPTKTIGHLPKIGTKAKDFNLIGKDLKEVTLNDFKGRMLVLNIFPAIDTGVCASSVRNFNIKAAKLSNTNVLCISRDLPFAQNRFCGAEGIENVLTLSDFVSGKFGEDYQLTILDGPFSNLLSRCVIVLDEAHKVLYTEQVSDIASEPNYEEALAALK